MSLHSTSTLTYYENVENLRLAERDVGKIQDVLDLIDERGAPSPLLALIGTSLAIMLQAVKTAMGRTSGRFFSDATFTKVLDFAVFWKSYLVMLPSSSSYQELSHNKRMVVIQVVLCMTRAVSAYIQNDDSGVEQCLRMFGDIGKTLQKLEYRDDREYFDFLSMLGVYLKRIGEYGLERLLR
jgi:hypothetical protein